MSGEERVGSGWVRDGDAADIIDGLKEHCLGLVIARARQKERLVPLLAGLGRALHRGGELVLVDVPEAELASVMGWIGEQGWRALAPLVGTPPRGSSPLRWVLRAAPPGSGAEDDALAGLLPGTRAEFDRILVERGPALPVVIFGARGLARAALQIERPFGLIVEDDLEETAAALRQAAPAPAPAGPRWRERREQRRSLSGKGYREGPAGFEELRVWEGKGAGTAEGRSAWEPDQVPVEHRADDGRGPRRRTRGPAGGPGRGGPGRGGPGRGGPGRGGPGRGGPARGGRDGRDGRDGPRGGPRHGGPRRDGNGGGRGRR